MASGFEFATAATGAADVRSIAELEQWFPLADLESGALALAA
jgi:hypothetical protein